MSDSHPSRILVVEDDRINRRILESRLQEKNYSIVLAESGPEALEVLAGARKDPKRAIDLVLLDVMMPGMDGIEVLSRVRAEASPIDLPVIMVTARNRSDDIVAALEARANDYVTKPIDFAVLFVRMATHLDLKATHEALRKSQLSLIHAAKLESVGYLAAGLAHEIRNPLAQIQMTIDALRRQVKDPGGDAVKGNRLLDGMEKSVLRADEIVKGLLHYSDTTRLQLRSCDLNEIIQEVLDLMEREVVQSSAEIRLELFPGQLPAMCAHEETRQILVNILLNALQAMPSGGRITIRSGDASASPAPLPEGARSAAAIRPGGSGALIEVLDTGPGVSELDLPRLYDPFYTSRPTGSGTGLGLTVARQLMELQGGIIDVRNRDDGPGLHVRLTLPQSAALFV